MFCTTNVYGWAVYLKVGYHSNPQACKHHTRSHKQIYLSMASRNVTTTEKTSDFEPLVWGNFFINHEPPPLQMPDEWMRERADKLKGEVCMLFETCNDVGARLNLVAAIQRIGIDHLFQEQIATALNDIHNSEFNSSSLHETALHFSLLREHGLWVSPDVFNKFKGEDGRFRTDITNEPLGLLSLYNAAHLFIYGEPALEEAISFARQHLESMRGNLRFPLAKQVERALHLPLPRTNKRVETLHYISEYEQEEGHNPNLLELAKLDFNLLQRVHLVELKAICEWWKDIYGYVGLSFARDRVVESYTCGYIVFYEKEFMLARVIYTKIFLLIMLMDDIYDSHATIEECRKLNAAIQRWDESAISLLPEYLKKFYNKLLGIFKEFEGEVAISENYRVAYAKKAFQKQSTYYLQEAEWSNQNLIPSFKDQLNVSTMSFGVLALSVGMMAGMGDAIMKRAIEWALGNSDAVRAAGKIGRFMNDIAALKHGKTKGDVVTSVECYMNEHKVTREVAFAKIESFIEDEWKTMNQARFEHHALLPAVQRVVNQAVASTLFFANRNDAYSFDIHLQKIAESLFVKPIPI